jgi:anti-sigma B factor antagonist
VPLLEVSVSDGDNGPVLALSGEADLTTLRQLNSALDEQIWAGPRLLTVDLSRLRYADSATIAALVHAARTLRGQGGELELLRPQSAVARVLSLTGVDQALTVRGETEPGPAK